MKEIHIWEFILSQFKKNNSVILTVVVDHRKGSPGKQGFKMAVSSNGDVTGSIGGGIMEYKIISNYKKLLKKNIPINKLETLYHNKNRNVINSGLICSGSQTNYSVSLKKKDIKIIKDIKTAVNDQKEGRILIDPEGISFNTVKTKIPEFSFIFTGNNDWKFEQSTGKKNIVYIIGGGHVGAAVCRVLHLLDFYIIIYDSRKNLIAMKNDAYANKILKGSYKNLGDALEDDSYVIIVTSGFDSDKDALMQVIKKNVKYIGLMGTKAKIKRIFGEAKKEGISDELLKKIHAPIGIDINSDTPEEIAVSIAAEIIREKNKKN
jgi:xanthine dehydrogenase accessory factor